MECWKSQLSSTAMVLALLSCLAICKGMPIGGDSDSERKATDPSADREDFIKIGDMTFIKHEDRERRNAIWPNNHLWPGGIVPYDISPEYNWYEQRIIHQAMDHWEEHTCIRFRPQTENDTHAINFMHGSGCTSFVGRIAEKWQPQGISLGTNCVQFSVVVHELGHAVGFYHEHSRADRDEYVEIKWENIESGLAFAFRKLEPGAANTLGYAYDYESIMHYRANAFSINGQDTVVSKQPGVTLRGDKLSPLDIAKANALYNCNPCRDGDVRVSEGTHQDGFLEYCVDGYWGVVCGNNWDNNEAEIACRQLGYQHSPDTSYEAVFARRPDPLLMFLSYINCGGDETQLSQCPYLNNAGPTDGIVWEGDGKVYCPWGGYVDGLYEYQVAKVHCSVQLPQTTSSQSLITTPAPSGSTATTTPSGSTATTTPSGSIDTPSSTDTPTLSGSTTTPTPSGSTAMPPLTSGPTLTA